MEQNIKPILWVKLPAGHLTQEQTKQISDDLSSRAKDYIIVITPHSEVKVDLEVLSPYKDNGEIPEELLTWLKNQNDGNN